MKENLIGYDIATSLGYAPNHSSSLKGDICCSYSNEDGVWLDIKIVGGRKKALFSYLHKLVDIRTIEFTLPNDNIKAFESSIYEVVGDLIDKRKQDLKTLSRRQ